MLVFFCCTCINRGLVDDATQTSDGAGASPHTSLEEKQMLPANLRVELTTQDHQLAELKNKLDHEKLLNQELEKNVSHLQAGNADMAEEVKCLRGLLRVSLYSRTIMLKPCISFIMTHESIAAKQYDLNDCKLLLLGFK